ncbi:MAG TPA: hypothetical protein VL990_17920 [Acidobacteriaceae bacterium]|nr:hypothetical protein [Acidobacteriaceae bacterium]
MSTMPPTGSTSSASPTRSRKAQHEFRLFWVAGTAGAFFAGLADHIPADLLHLGERFSRVLLLRYAYAVWLLAYFFISNFGITEETSTEPLDLLNDIVQSIAGLTAVFFLGFGAGEEPFNAAHGFLAANIAIGVICLLTFAIFPAPWNARITILRLSGALCAVLGLCISLHHLSSSARPSWALGFLLGLQIPLYLVLLDYFWMSWTREREYSRKPFGSQP